MTGAARELDNYDQLIRHLHLPVTLHNYEFNNNSVLSPQQKTFLKL